MQVFASLKRPVFLLALLLPLSLLQGQESSMTLKAFIDATPGAIEQGHNHDYETTTRSVHFIARLQNGSGETLKDVSFKLSVYRYEGYPIVRTGVPVKLPTKAEAFTDAQRCVARGDFSRFMLETSFEKQSLQVDPGQTLDADMGGASFFEQQAERQSVRIPGNLPPNKYYAGAALEVFVAGKRVNVTFEGPVENVFKKDHPDFLKNGTEVLPNADNKMQSDGPPQGDSKIEDSNILTPTPVQ